MIAAAPTVIEHVEEPQTDGDNCDNGCVDDDEAGNA